MIHVQTYAKIVAFVTLFSVPHVFTLVGVNKNTFLFALPPYPRFLNTSFDEYTVVQVGTFNTSMANLTILDLAFREPQNRSKITIKRRILNMDRDEIYVTELQLRVPDNLTAFKLYDTSKLKPDYRKIEIGVRPLMVPAFATGSLKVNRSASSDVLVIGLGGAQLTNYLHYAFPKMNLRIAEIEPTMVEVARKYFGMIEDKTQRVYVMDGLDYLRTAVKHGWKYDALYIDACPTKYPYEVEIMCPVPIFLNDSNISLMRKVLKNNGSLVIKMLLFSLDIDELAEKIANHYRKHFANCAVLEMVTANNRVIVCSPKGIPKSRYTAKALQDNAVKFYARLGLMDEECCLEAVSECCIEEHPYIRRRTKKRKSSH